VIGKPLRAIGKRLRAIGMTFSRGGDWAAQVFRPDHPVIARLLRLGKPARALPAAAALECVRALVVACENLILWP